MAELRTSTWEILCKTDLYTFPGSLSPSYNLKSYLPSDVEENINKFIIYLINVLLSKPDILNLEYDESDLLSMEIMINRALNLQHEENNTPRIRVQLYPDCQGINIVITAFSIGESNQKDIKLLPETVPIQTLSNGV